MSEWISTKEAMQILGVGSTTIKRWADEDILPSIRTIGGHRRFQRSAVLRFLEDSSGSAEARRWIRELRSRDVLDIRHEIEQMYVELGDWFAVAEYFGRVVTEIGRCWSDGVISIVDEHIISARLSQALVAVAGQLQVPEDSTVCLLATPTGERHMLGLCLTQLCMRSSNIDALWVGVELPADELSRHLRERGDEQQMVALSASRWMTDAVTLQSIYEEIAAECRAQNIMLILGGGGAWPESVDWGHRCHSFEDLRRALEETYKSRSTAN